MSENIYPITSRFFQQESFRNHKHLGIDFGMPNHTPLRSIQDGYVEKVLHLKNNVGNAVFVKWNDGKVAIYGHMSEIDVRVGDKVRVGDLLGYSGNSGTVVGQNGGYHLHFGLKDANGNFIDPTPHIEQIQNMNNPALLVKLTESPEIISTKLSFMDYFQQHMGVLTDFLNQTKINLISFLESTDYSPFIKGVKYVVQFIFFNT